MFHGKNKTETKSIHETEKGLFKALPDFHFLSLDIAYGSIITLRNHRVGGGLLHSHPHLYPEELGPKQQQVCMNIQQLWLIFRTG